MKVRDSGMPDEEMWATFFDARQILMAFGINRNIGDIVEFGSGYGTFTLEAARLVSGTVHALDIEPELVRLVQSRAVSSGVGNISARVRDFVGSGSGMPDNSVDVVLLFNILHHEQPVALMAEALRILLPEGRLAVIHWNHDPTTPRGPSLDIRPKPEQCISWGVKAGFQHDPVLQFDFKPFHYGILFLK